MPPDRKPRLGFVQKLSLIHILDVILDTDAFNEIDDQFALSYLLASSDKLNTVAITAAPFLNSLSESPADGMEKSYNEIFKVLDLADRNDLKSNVYRGSSEYLHSETEPVESDAAKAIVKFALKHTSEKPLYIVAIGAITNVASAILMNREICNRVEMCIRDRLFIAAFLGIK